MPELKCSVLTGKGFLANENIVIKHKNKLIADDSKLAHLFNNQHINIVESNLGAPPESDGNPDCK